MSFVRSMLIQYMLLGSTLMGCGFNDGFLSAEYKGVITRAPTDSTLSTDYAYEIHTKNAMHVTGFPNIFFENQVDTSQVLQVVNWHHWLNDSEKCIEGLAGDGSYSVDCGDNIGELTVFLTYSNTANQQNTLFIRTMIGPDQGATETEVFPRGR